MVRKWSSEWGPLQKVYPDHKWHCRFLKNKVQVTVTVRIGVDLWNYIAGQDLAFVELCASLLRACVKPAETTIGKKTYTIFDLEQIISLDGLPETFNTKIIQRSQLEWLFFFARHFCDDLVSGDMETLVK